MDIQFWEPVNSAGVAATAELEHEGQPVEINFYWSIMETVSSPKDQNDLEDQIREFMPDVLTLVEDNSEKNLHIEIASGDFYRVDDPGWQRPIESN